MSLTTNIQTKQKPFRGDLVGSLLRPARIKRARKQVQTGEISHDALREIENAEIIRLVEKQKEIGLSDVTDGEIRRKYWHLDFIEQIEGIETYDEETKGFFQGEMKKLTKYKVAGKLKFPDHHTFLDDFKFLNSVADDHTAKFTIPGPNMIFHSGVIANSHYAENPAYPSLDAVAADIVHVYKDAIQAFYQAGCRYLQLDDTSWGAFFSDKFRQTMEQNGFETDAMMQYFADITIRALEDKPDDMAITLHICRGNFKSSWLYEGGYEPIAEQLFARVNVDGFFLEFDTDRAGSFAPLKHINGQRVVLGLVTTKESTLENKKAIKARIKEAEQYVPKDQLCLSPQCGFASTEEGNLLSEEDQWAKLQLVVDVARDVWG